MKRNMSRVDYASGFKKQDVNSRWWTWDEICDKCGSQIRTNGGFGMLLDKNATPNSEEKDLCVECMRKHLDEIPKREFCFSNRVK